MIKLLKETWGFYVSGAVFAFLFVITLFILDSPIGMSDAYLMISDYCQEVIENEEINEAPPIDWQTGFLLGVFIGAMTAAIMSKKWEYSFFPEECKRPGFISSLGLTLLRCAGGGFLVMLGLQLAGDSFLGQWAAATQRSTGAIMFICLTMFTGMTLKLFLNAFTNKGKEE